MNGIMFWPHHIQDGTLESILRKQSKPDNLLLAPSFHFSPSSMKMNGKAGPVEKAPLRAAEKPVPSSDSKVTRAFLKATLWCHSSSDPTASYG